MQAVRDAIKHGNNDTVVLKVDFENAFNAGDRLPILHEVEEHFSRWLLGVHSISSAKEQKRRAPKGLLVAPHWSCQTGGSCLPCSLPLWCGVPLMDSTFLAHQLVLNSGAPTTSRQRGLPRSPKHCITYTWLMTPRLSSPFFAPAWRCQGLLLHSGLPHLLTLVVQQRLSMPSLIDRAAKRSRSRWEVTSWCCECAIVVWPLEEDRKRGNTST